MTEALGDVARKGENEGREEVVEDAEAQRVLNKERSTLVQIVPKITARWGQMEFCILCPKSRQNERSSVVCSFNVNKLSRLFT